LFPTRQIANRRGRFQREIRFVVPPSGGSVLGKQICFRKTGATDGELIEIAEGVKTGEIIATSNLDKLQTGAIVSSGR
jgi:hypothetical protein